jgi:hypothetical protein
MNELIYNKRNWELVLSIKFHGARQDKGRVTQNVLFLYRLEPKSRSFTLTVCCLGTKSSVESNSET